MAIVRTKSVEYLVREIARETLARENEMVVEGAVDGTYTLMTIISDYDETSRESSVDVDVCKHVLKLMARTYKNAVHDASSAMQGALNSLITRS